jgi:hypothetical protein
MTIHPAFSLPSRFQDLSSLLHHIEERGVMQENPQSVCHVVHVVPWVSPVTTSDSLSTILYQHYTQQGIPSTLYPHDVERLTPALSRRFEARALLSPRSSHKADTSPIRVWIAPWLTYHAPQAQLQGDEDTLTVPVLKATWEQMTAHTSNTPHKAHPPEEPSAHHTLIWVFHHPECLLAQQSDIELTHESYRRRNLLTQAMTSPSQGSEAYSIPHFTYEQATFTYQALRCETHDAAYHQAHQQLAINLQPFTTRAKAHHALKSIPSTDANAQTTLCLVCDTPQEKQWLLETLPPHIPIMTFAQWWLWQTSKESRKTNADETNHTLAPVYKHIFWFSKHLNAGYMVLLLQQFMHTSQNHPHENQFLSHRILWAFFEPEDWLPWFQSLYTSLKPYQHSSISHGSYQQPKPYTPQALKQAFIHFCQTLHLALSTSRVVTWWLFLHYLYTPQCERQRLKHAFFGADTSSYFSKTTQPCGICGPCTGDAQRGWHPLRLFLFLLK